VTDGPIKKGDRVFVMATDFWAGENVRPNEMLDSIECKVEEVGFDEKRLIVSARRGSNKLLKFVSSRQVFRTEDELETAMEVFRFRKGDLVTGLTYDVWRDVSVTGVVTKVTKTQMHVLASDMKDYVVKIHKALLVSRGTPNNQNDPGDKEVSG